MTYQTQQRPAATGRRVEQGQQFHVQSASAEPLLQRLEGVRRTGEGRWSARCPAHADRSPSLAIAELPEKVLVRCYAGCQTADVLAAIGLTFSDLFPARHWPETPEERRRARRAIREAGWSSALSVMAVEASVVRIAARQVAAWVPLSDEDDARLALAVQRIEGAASVLVEAATWRPTP